MEEMLVYSLKIHLYSLAIMTAIALSHIVMSILRLDFFKYRSFVKNIVPIYLVLFTIVIFTGLLMLTIHQFHISFSVALMLAISVLVFVTEILRHRKLKNTRLKLVQSQHKYKEFAIKTYSFMFLVFLGSIAIIEMKII